MAAVECKSRDSDSAELSKTPVYTNEVVTTIEKHENSGTPLQTPWTFWLDKVISGSTVEEYKANLTKIYTVNTVQSFWAVFNNIPNAGDMQIRYSYHLMRDNRYPLWEEPVNERGGTWRFKCHKHDTGKVWTEVVLATIGEQFSDAVADGDDICGVTVSIRDREDLIQIWNVDAALAPKASVQQKVQLLVPEISLTKRIYKPHQSNYAYGRR